jgi:hypothetical protein
MLNACPRQITEIAESARKHIAAIQQFYEANDNNIEILENTAYVHNIPTYCIIFSSYTHDDDVLVLSALNRTNNGCSLPFVLLGKLCDEVRRNIMFHIDIATPTPLNGTALH